MFSSAERESAYVIDGLMHNEVVKSDIHSTDAFGFSELVFAVSHLLGFSYAPRFKNLERQRLYIFRSRKGSDRSAWKIKAAGYAEDEIVIQQWDEILRLIATIKLKEVTASDLFRRLNSYSKQHALYQALKAFGQVPKSLFILQVIDDPVLRQAIEKQLDRIEHVHAGPGIFPGDAACKCPPFVSAGSWFLIPYCAPNFCTGSLPPPIMLETFSCST